MKIELLKNHLEESLQTVSKVSNKNLSLPVLGCVVIVATKNKTVLRATNLDISVEVQLKAKVFEEGSVAVPAVLFSQTIQTTTDQKITLQASENILLLIGSHGEAKMNTLDVSEFPTLPFVKEGEGVMIQLPSKELVRTLKAVSFAASASGIRPELSSVFLRVTGGFLIAAATDSFRLAEMKLPIKNKETIDPVLIPVRNIQDIIRVIQKTDTTELRVSENQITCIADGNYITSRIIDGAFPEYGAIFPKTFVSTTTVLVEDFIKALRKVSVFVDGTGQIEVISNTEKKHFSVRATNTPVGETYETLDAALDGESLTSYFNVRYLLDALSVVSTDSIVLKNAGAGKPMLLQEVPEKGFTYMVMPMNK